MQEVIIADLALPSHAAAILYLLNEYAKDDMGGGAELSAYAKANLIAELRKRQGTHIVLAFVDSSPAGLAICFEGFSTFACKPQIGGVRPCVLHPTWNTFLYQAALSIKST